MAEGCNHNCSSCGESCSSRTAPQSLLEVPHEGTKIKHIIAVISGKGGVGKSSVTTSLAVTLNRLGYKTAVLDADITKTGIKMMSINLLIEDQTAPVIWRGPIIAGAVKQFYTDVVWGDIDYMLVDCPPGTGDVPLTVFQSLPVDGAVIVTTPQDLVSLIVEKAVRMADDMGIRILGLVENMSYFKCPDCGKEHSIFGESKVEEIRDRFGIETVVKLPIDPALAGLMDEGKIEDMPESKLKEFAQMIVGKIG